MSISKHHPGGQYTPPPTFNDSILVRHELLVSGVVVRGVVQLEGPVPLARLGVIPLIRLALCVAQLLQDGVDDGYHHGRGRRVADPHGQEGCDAH